MREAQTKIYSFIEGAIGLGHAGIYESPIEGEEELFRGTTPKRAINEEVQKWRLGKRDTNPYSDHQIKHKAFASSDNMEACFYHWFGDQWTVWRMRDFL